MILDHARIELAGRLLLVARSTANTFTAFAHVLSLALHRPLVQSRAPSTHFLPGSHGRQYRPPQSTSVSSPFCWWSLHHSEVGDVVGLTVGDAVGQLVVGLRVVGAYVGHFVGNFVGALV